MKPVPRIAALTLFFIGLSLYAPGRRSPFEDQDLIEERHGFSRFRAALQGAAASVPLA